MSVLVKLNSILNSKEAISGAIEGKGITVGSTPLSGYATLISQISGEGGGPSDFDFSAATVTAADMLNGISAYGPDGELVTGAIGEKTSETYTPTTVDQTIEQGYYLAGEQIIKGDTNLVAGNIKSGTTIFGVIGSYSGLNTSDATAVASTILSGYTAYVNGTKITGNVPNKGSLSITPSSSSQSFPSGYYSEISVAAAANNGSGEKIYPLYYCHSTYWDNPRRIMAADINLSGSTFTFPTPWRIGGSNALIFNGNLYWHSSEINDSIDSRSFIISNSGDWDYITSPNDRDNFVAIKDGKLAFVHASYNSNPFNNGSDPISITVPTNSPSGITQLIQAYGCYYCIDGDGHPCAFQGSTDSSWTIIKNTNVTISKILNQYISDWGSYGEPFHGCIAINTNGDLIKLNTEPDDNFMQGEAEIYVETLAQANGDPFLNYFYYPGEGMAMYFEPVCVNFAIRNSGLWYKNGDNGAWTQAQNAPTLLSGNMLGYAKTSIDEDGNNEETGDPNFVVNISQVALHIDSTGKLWKLSANADTNGSFTGLNITQVGSDTDWTYVSPTYGKNEAHIAQKGGKLYILKASNDNNFTFTLQEYYRKVDGKLIMNNAEGLWLVPSSTTVDLTQAGGTIGSVN